jgi:carbamate kinase
MGPKVEAAAAFAERSGHRAVIGKIDDIDAILAGRAGTVIEARDGTTEFYRPAAHRERAAGLPSDREVRPCH